MINKKSILTDIKLMCGIPADITDFDAILLLHCNTVFAALTQMGLNAEDTFFITDENWQWSDLFDDELNLHNIKSYVYLKVKLLFDPPANATLIQSMESQASELEWRIRMELESTMGV